MSQPVTHSSQSHSRLIRFLTDLAVVDSEIIQRDFAERLGSLLDFADSILLADALRLPDVVLPERQAMDDDVRAVFLRVRGNLVATIVSGCRPDATQARIRWPSVAHTGDSISFDPFLRFYVAQQRDMDLGVRTLRSTVREMMAGVSVRLQQLVALDIALEDTLWEHSRRFLAVVPRFLQRRFDWLQQQHQQRMSGSDAQEKDGAVIPHDTWLRQLNADVQGLLLAELELRLQPVLGLVEAMHNEETGTT